jgi:hypothetical protein
MATCPVHAIKLPGCPHPSPADTYRRRLAVAEQTAPSGSIAPDHLWPCGCLRNDGGAHRGACPDYRTVNPKSERRYWVPRTDPAKED